MYYCLIRGSCYDGESSDRIQKTAATTPVCQNITTEWSEWTTCDKDCREGNQIRTKPILGGETECFAPTQNRSCFHCNNPNEVALLIPGYFGRVTTAYNYLKPRTRKPKREPTIQNSTALVFEIKLPCFPTNMRIGRNEIICVICQPSAQDKNGMCKGASLPVAQTGRYSYIGKTDSACRRYGVWKLLKKQKTCGQYKHEFFLV